MQISCETDIRVSSDGPLIAQCNWSNPDVDSNARLIAAAPELFSACCEALVELQNAHKDAPCPCTDPDGTACAMQRCIAMVQAAIAKAEGR